MWSSPACELKQYIAQVSPNKAIRWIDEAEAASDTYSEQQKIEPGDLELFKCVQVQCETIVTLRTEIIGDLPLTCDFSVAEHSDRPRARAESAGSVTLCDMCPAKFTGRPESQKSNLRRHIREKHRDTLKLPCSNCDATFGRSYNLKKHVISCHR